MGRTEGLPCRHQRARPGRARGRRPCVLPVAGRGLTDASADVYDDAPPACPEIMHDEIRPPFTARRRSLHVLISEVWPYLAPVHAFPYPGFALRPARTTTRVIRSGDGRPTASGTRSPAWPRAMEPM